MRFAGLNITYPCKQLVLPLLDAVSDEADAIGAVNTVVRTDDRLIGYNTDGSGWSWGFRRALPQADLSSVVLLGAGGAGSACADAALRLGAARLVIVDRDAPRAVALAARLNKHLDGGAGQRRHRPARCTGRCERPHSCDPDGDGGHTRHAAAGGMAEARDVGFGRRLRASGNAVAQGGSAPRVRHGRWRPHERRPGRRRLQALHRPRRGRGADGRTFPAPVS